VGTKLKRNYIWRYAEKEVVEYHLSRKCGSLYVSQPYGFPRTVRGTALLYVSISKFYYLLGYKCI
jgi:hypothetical protein